MAATPLNFSLQRKVPIILQNEIAECALACLAMVAGYHGHNLDMPAIRKYQAAGLNGMTLQQMMTVAEQLELAPRALQCPIADISQLRFPCILHWDMNHFIVLSKIKGKGSRARYYINDPARGSRVITQQEFASHYTGICLELTPTGSFREQNIHTRLKFFQLWSKCTGMITSVSKLIVLSLMLQLFVLIAPYYMQWVVDEVLVSFDHALLVILAIGFSFLVLISALTNALRSWLIVRISSVLNLQVGLNLFSHLLRLPMTFFESRHIGDLVSRFGSLAQIRERLTHGFVETLVDGVMAIALLIMMFVYSPKLSFIVLAVVAIYTLIRFLLYRPLHSATQQLIQSSANEQSHFLETARSMQTLKLLGQEAQRQSAWQHRFAEIMNNEIRLGRLTISFETSNKLLFGLENVLIIYLAAKMVMTASITVGMLLAFIAYKNQFTTRMMNLIEQLIQFKMMRLHLDRVADIALHDVEANRHGNASVLKPKGNIQLIDVCFDYQGQSSAKRPILNGINLTIDAGQSIAIAGPSGTGKSTLMKIMLGLIQPTHGKVLLDGRDITQLGLLNYRQCIAAVLQDDTLLAGSIADNICAFEAPANPLKIEQSAKVAAIHHDIEQMTMGYQSLVGDMGTSLSGGQVQRVLLARALYRQPCILFLDEATSHLDKETEAQISRQVSGMEMTRIIIAHRQETLNTADVVYYLSDGQLRREPKVQEQRVNQS
ncbi:peptidase domain-containing ABC transporter [Thalassotalea mangrovi]|uniref:Peptidase domain-containing ABC transporter n=1 Tax=Thalassotalea mangrovi TaxID=2572245 RepID=A0A4U1B5J6_9GAMM|nr:peptidase domain-containing ABC transporter [Thalassotalea mangrovi]TKB45633.1 peptidase domain-containing ABC transporter [Thalassotalea mangrovi]